VKRRRKEVLAWLVGGLTATVGLAAYAGLREIPGEPLPQGIRVTVAADEGVVEPDGRVTPLYLDGSEEAKLCLVVDPKDHRFEQWAARLTVRGGVWSPSWRHRPPLIRLGSTLCFAKKLRLAGLPAWFPATGAARLCGTIEDRFDGRVFTLPCQPIRFGTGGAARAGIQRRFETLSEALGQGAMKLAPWLAEMDALAARARARGLDFFAARIELTAIDRSLAGRELATARARLAAMPAWLLGDDPGPASLRAAAKEYEWGMLELDGGGSLRAAAEHLRRAETFYQRVAGQQGISAASRLSEVYTRVGNVSEAAARLRAAIDRCSPETCKQDVLSSAKGDLAWLILLDPDADDEQLEKGRRLTTEALAEATEPSERADRLINLAYLERQLRQDPRAILGEVRKILTEKGLPIARQRFLAGWADLVEAKWALTIGTPERARALCDRLVARQDPLLTTWALSCIGEAHLALGEPDKALASFDRALVLHEFAAPEQLGERLPLGPGQRADDFYQAANAAVMLAEPARAWELLDRLDGLVASEEEERGCERTLTGEQRADALASERRRDELLAEITALEAPASGLRRRQIEFDLFKKRDELRRLSRQLSPCIPRERHPAPVTTVDYRALALPREVLLLRRTPAGRITLAKRTPMDRKVLIRSLREIGRELDRPLASDDEWRRRVAPFADLVIPAGFRPETPVLRFALHGPLQGLPLAALPVPGDPQARYLTDLATIVLHPALAELLPAAPAAPFLSAPLFVVDPEQNLRDAAGSARFYHGLSSGARVFEGPAATLSALADGLGGASLLHVDAHGYYDETFPELSSLGLADGRLPLSRIAALDIPRGLVNLSGCRTGGWPVTADSGRYGLAGLFARLGAGWVVASRSNLGDRVARDFNQVFYRELKAGAGVPASYRRALSTLRQRYRAVDWAGLLRLEGAGGRGQTDRQVTPSHDGRTASRAGLP